MEAVKLYMDESLLTIDSGASCLEAAQKMCDNNIGALLVKDKEFYVGIVTEGDLSRRVMAQELSPKEVKVKRIMTSSIVTLDCRVSMTAAFLEMSRKKIRHLAVTDRGRYVGILSVKDFAAYYTHKLAWEK
ncbi:MAG: cyclic nucleotide-binding/CBS domain-containing protein [Nitrospinales bacterium]